MSAKLGYYFMRIMEAPPGFTLRKLWMRAKPHVYRLHYAWYRLSGATLESHVISERRLRAIQLGRSLAAHLRSSGARDADFVSKASDRARRALDGKVDSLGYGSASIPSGNQWWADPFHGYTWPCRYFAHVDFVARNSHCDVKVPWELSRFHYLTWLCEGAVFGGESAAKYRDRFTQIVLDWIENNPVGFGVNWTCPMEVAIRATNLTLAFSIFSEDLEAAVCETILNCLDQHARFIDRFPELSDVPGNHYLADLAGYVFPTMLAPGAGGQKLGQSILAFTEEAQRQFEPEGSHIERAPVYHRLCLEMVALVVAVAVRHRYDVDALSSVLRVGLDYCDSIGTAKGKLPIFGDNDSGHFLKFDLDARDCTGLRQFSLRLHSLSSHVTDDLAHWLCALSGIESNAPRQIFREPVFGAVTAQRSGYLSARNGSLKAVMRVGTQGLLGRAPHDHDDALSIWLTRGEQELIIEEGCHSYTLDSEVRARYIGSAAHNVVQCVGRFRFLEVQGSICGTMRGAPTASTWAHEVRDGEARLEAALDVPSRPGQLFEHCRRVVSVRSQSRVVVSDEWIWQGSEAAELRWHFGIGLNTQVDGSGAHIRDLQGRTVMEVEIDSGMTFSVAQFGYEYAPAYGASVPCSGLVVTFAQHKSCSVRSTFVVIENDESIG